VKTRDFLRLSRSELAAMLTRGHPIDPNALDDTEYRGVSLGLPAPIVALSWLTFVKTFHRDPITRRLRGWNVRVEQTGIDGPVIPMRTGGRPTCFGHYEVGDARGCGAPIPCEQGLLIDYGRGSHGRFDPMRRARDPIVALEAGSTERLLGWTYLAIGSRRVGTPSFFLLERRGALTHVEASATRS
jgi:hypothetical protein